MSFTRLRKAQFTLIELLVVVAIIGILASILMPSLSKARLKAMRAVCVSNLKQCGTAVANYTADDDDTFPFAANVNNNGRHWIGKKGSSAAYSLDVTERPLNEQLGYNTDGTEVKVANCPLAAANKVANYDTKGTYYYGAARNEQVDDLDGGAKNQPNIPPLKVTNIYHPSQMIVMSEKDNSDFIMNPGGKWIKRLHKPGKNFFPMVFIDGHAAEHFMQGGEGWNFESEKANSRNFE